MVITREKQKLFSDQETCKYSVLSLYHRVKGALNTERVPKELEFKC